MLNESELHLNEYDTTRFLNNFIYNMNVWRDETCAAWKYKQFKGKIPQLQKGCGKVSFLIYCQKT